MLYSFFSLFLFFIEPLCGSLYLLLVLHFVLWIVFWNFEFLHSLVLCSCLDDGLCIVLKI
ncbi:hypothetical protein IC575_002605 [Cucumis melo]